MLVEMHQEAEKQIVAACVSRMDSITSLPLEST